MCHSTMGITHCIFMQEVIYTAEIAQVVQTIHCHKLDLILAGLHFCRMGIASVNLTQLAPTATA